MSKSILALCVAALATAADATSVATLEIGKGGVVHRTSPGTTTTSSSGVLSFLKSLHDVSSDGQPRKERVTQYPGMNVVPDLFNRPVGGFVIGIHGESIDLDSMPTIAEKVGEAQMYVKGNKGRDLMKKLSNKKLSVSEFEAAINQSTAPEVNQMESLSVSVNESEDAANVDAAVSRLLEFVSKAAENNESTIMVHLVVDDESSRRRLEDNNAADDDDTYNDIKQNEYYKSMFQIQYFNICLWTALGLIGILASANLMTMFMPLMPDTLLFGESAKMVAE